MEQLQTEQSSPDLLKGLTDEQVREQQELGNVNELPDSEAMTVEEIIKKNVFTYFNYIFFGLTVLLIIARSFRDLTFLPVIIFNTVIGIVQQLYAKSVLDKLSLLSVSDYWVMRNGEKQKIAMDELVLGDTVVLESGQQIPADAVVLGGSLAVNESMLTGESDEIEKVKGSELKSGSFIISGMCLARLTHVGADSYAAKLTEKAKKVEERPSEMIRGIELIIKIAGILIIPLGILLMYQSMAVNHMSFSESVVSMVGAVIGMIPEGLYLLVTVALALSAARLAQKQVLLHDMRSTETLARVDTLCVDKTGTITDSNMKVQEVFGPEGSTEEDRQKAEKILAAYVYTVGDTNDTAKALKNHYAEVAPLSATSVSQFSSSVKYSEIVTEQEILRFGAPEYLLEEWDLQQNQPLIAERAGKGERVLALVRDDGSLFRPLLFVSLMNPLRENAADTFAYLTEQEVDIRVISGDNPLTVSKVADLAGIPSADQFIDASELDTYEKIREAVRKYKVFGRVKPEQKKSIVLALKEEGRKVAMTGDGVNDILAMKEADCSIAMGEGSDAARQAAQVVLLDSDFSHMKEIIAEGRRDINNITRSATLFMYKNLFSLFLAVFSIINVFAYPLQATQVSLISMFNIGIPAFALALEPNFKKQKGRFLPYIFLESLPAALTCFLAIAAMVVFGQTFDISPADVGVASTFLLSIVGFFILAYISKPLNGYRIGVIVFCAVGLIYFTWRFHDLYAIQHVSAQCVMLFVVFAIAEESVMRYITRAFERGRDLADKWFERQERKAEEAARRKKKTTKKASGRQKKDGKMNGKNLLKLLPGKKEDQ